MFKAAIGRISKQFPNYFVVLRNFRFVDTDSVPTASITQDLEFMYNPKFLSKLDEEEKYFIFLHEVHHVINNHFVRFVQVNTVNHFSHMMCNMAADMEVNSYIISKLGIHPPKGLVLPGDYGMEESQTFEYYLSYFLKNKSLFNIMMNSDLADKGNKGNEGEANDKDEDKDSNSSSSSSSSEFKPWNRLSDDVVVTNGNGQSNTVDKAIHEFEEANGRSAGRSGYSTMRNFKLKPIYYDWKKLIASLLKKDRATYDYSYAKMNRRSSFSDIIYPRLVSSHPDKYNIIFMIDVSGSVYNMLDKIVNYLNSLYNYLVKSDKAVKLNVMLFSHEVLDYFEITSKKSFNKLKVGGGTNACGFKYILDNNIKYDNLIVATDGEFEWEYEDFKNTNVLLFRSGDWSYYQDKIPYNTFNIQL